MLLLLWPSFWVQKGVVCAFLILKSWQTSCKSRDWNWVTVEVLCSLSRCRLSHMSSCQAGHLHFWEPLDDSNGVEDLNRDRSISSLASQNGKVDWVLVRGSMTQSLVARGLVAWD